MSSDDRKDARRSEAQRSERESRDQRLELLEGKSSVEVLKKILPEDPLGLATLCSDRIDQLVVFMSAERLRMRSVARVASDSMSTPYPGRPNLDGWLMARVDQSIRELIAEDYEALRRGIPFDDRDQMFCSKFAEATGLAVERVREVCVRFNLLDPLTREAFYCVAFERQPIEMYAKSVGEAVELVEGRVADAAEIFARAQEQDPEGRDGD